jgi:hypothetical protein
LKETKWHGNLIVRNQPKPFLKDLRMNGWHEDFEDETIPVEIFEVDPRDLIDPEEFQKWAEEEETSQEKLLAN